MTSSRGSLHFSKMFKDHPIQTNMGRQANFFERNSALLFSSAVNIGVVSPKSAAQCASPKGLFVMLINTVASGQSQYNSDIAAIAFREVKNTSPDLSSPSREWE
ncbi:hypothetical protein ZTR_09193 [Talaromyces verruculosus]|nr:hypothetical protein ZTR_09193 [Talaromyces verruculosus]